MSLYDFIPHRLLLNRSLRKASEELRAKVDECQAEYERHLEECSAKIERLESGLSRKREIAQATIDEELAKHKEELIAVSSDVEAYADCYLRFECLRRTKKIRRAQIAIYREDDGFLSEQMRIIGEEIEILNARIDELASLTDIGDLIELANYTSSPLDLSSLTDCESLLAQVEARLSEQRDVYSSERFALVRLREIVRERAENLDTIQYIRWIIKQKITYSRQLSIKRDVVRSGLNAARSALSALDQEVHETDLELDGLALAVRMHWIRPIVYLSADIAYAKRRKRKIGERLHSVASNHEYDPDWDYLQRDFKRYGREVDEKRKEIKVWHDRRKLISSIFRRNNVRLRTDGNRGRCDELQLVRTRLDELQTIREEGAAEADARCEAERREVEAERDERLQGLGEELAAAERRVHELESLEVRRRGEYVAAIQRLKAAQSSDKRPILLRIFSDSAEVSIAKSNRGSAESKLDDTIDKLRDAKASRDEKASELRIETSSFGRKLAGCRPQPLRPTSDEILEEEKLGLLLRELESNDG